MKLKQKSSWITYREMLDQVTNNSIKSWLIENGPITKRISAKEDFELNLIRYEIDKVDELDKKYLGDDVGDIKVRTSTENDSYSPSDWFVMDDSDGDMIYTYTMTLITGVEYGYNFNNSDGSGYESGSTIEACGGGSYGNDRSVTPGTENLSSAIMLFTLSPGN